MSRPWYQQAYPPQLRTSTASPALPPNKPPPSSPALQGYPQSPYSPHPSSPFQQPAPFNPPPPPQSPYGQPPPQSYGRPPPQQPYGAPGPQYSQQPFYVHFISTRHQYCVIMLGLLMIRVFFRDSHTLPVLLTPVLVLHQDLDLDPESVVDLDLPAVLFPRPRPSRSPRTVSF